MSEITSVTGTGVPLLLDDIDTDRIIPARYLRCVTFDGLGENAFEDDRQQDPNHPFDNPVYRQGTVLVSGRNFGCGSSREHAPQALIRWGVKAVIAESFAEIFYGNCTSLGVPAVCASRADLEKLSNAIKADPNLEIRVDLEQCQVTYESESVPVTINESARNALMTGQYDFLAQLLDRKDKIQTRASEIPYMNQFAN
ncbi:3-isopropylmalate dehydratase small subunit [Polystyrenella longa]|uniref:3-isopropylmalate dehydratase n=1 Tax=Polystyrenella longa TaxID=2528007 RepID=A0A518CGM4_9PLAN|nr:3-isopropylmalate dehydratase small subunit [Polystyrenella longa]QDU78378.1 3-isopropylmalate dehydratase small subunit [Polystyrenella longa]